MKRSFDIWRDTSVVELGSGAVVRVVERGGVDVGSCNRVVLFIGWTDR